MQLFGIAYSFLTVDLQECFDPIVDPATGADLIPPMVYG